MLIFQIKALIKLESRSLWKKKSQNENTKINDSWLHYFLTATKFYLKL